MLLLSDRGSIKIWSLITLVMFKVDDDGSNEILSQIKLLRRDVPKRKSIHIHVVCHQVISFIVKNTQNESNERTSIHFPVSKFVLSKHMSNSYFSTKRVKYQTGISPIKQQCNA